MGTALTDEVKDTNDSAANSNAAAANQQQQQQSSSQQSNGSQKSWLDDLPDDLKSDANLKVIHDVPSLAKSFIHAQKMIGADKVVIPSKHATDADWDVVYDKLGRPKLEDYKFELPKESKFIDTALADQLKPLAHKAGIMPKQLEPILKWYDENMAKADAEMAKQKEAEIKAGLDGLKKEFGEAYSQKLSFAHQVLKEHGTKEMLELVDKDPSLGNNPHLIKLLSKVGELMYKEDGMPDGSNAKGSALTPDEARMKANEILADATHPYNNPEHPNHKAAVEEVRKHWESAYPKED